MKAEIDFDGCLTIKAETEIDGVALEKWWAGFHLEDKSVSYAKALVLKDGVFVDLDIF
jgi:hypothetical protein